MRRLTLACLVLLAAAPLLAADAPGKTAKVPFELLASKHMAVRVTINGKGPYRLIFDTGAPITLLSNRAAKEAGVLPKDARPPLLALFGAMGQFPIQTIEVADLKAEKVNAMVMDHPAVTAMGKMVGPLDGIVGYPFFARYTMTIDYQARELTFTPNGHEPDDIVDGLTAMLTDRRQPKPTVLAPAGVWGMTVGKDDEEAGVKIETVRPGSAAATAGLRVGDRLLTIDGRWTDTLTDCYQAAGLASPGVAVPVGVRRDGKTLRLMLTPRHGL
jgi:hypothetical protein